MVLRGKGAKDRILAGHSHIHHLVLAELINATPVFKLPISIDEAIKAPVGTNITAARTGASTPSAQSDRSNTSRRKAATAAAAAAAAVYRQLNTIRLQGGQARAIVR